jgi:hypothetical protein
MAVERTKVEHQGSKFANVCGPLWRVEQKSSRKDPDKLFHVLTMDDGIEIISWHTSDESRESYFEAEGHTIAAQVKVARTKGHTYFYLQSMRLTCACEKCKEAAENRTQPASTLLIL